MVRKLTAAEKKAQLQKSLSGAVTKNERIAQSEAANRADSLNRATTTSQVNAANRNLTALRENGGVPTSGSRSGADKLAALRGTASSGGISNRVANLQYSARENRTNNAFDKRGDFENSERILRESGISDLTPDETFALRNNLADPAIILGARRNPEQSSNLKKLTEEASREQSNRTFREDFKLTGVTTPDIGFKKNLFDAGVGDLSDSNKFSTENSYLAENQSVQDAFQGQRSLNSLRAGKMGGENFTSTSTLGGRAKDFNFRAGEINKRTGADVSFSLGNGQGILNQEGRNTRVSETRFPLVRGTFFKQFDIQEPTPMFDDQGNFIGLNNPTGDADLDGAYTGYYTAGDPNQKGFYQDSIRGIQEGYLDQTEEGAAYLDDLDRQSGFQLNELTRTDINTQNAISQGSQIGEQREDALSLDADTFFKNQRAVLAEQKDSIIQQKTAEKQRNDQILAQELAKIEKEKRAAVAARLTREGFGGGYTGDLTRSHQDRIDQIERDVKEEFENRKNQLISRRDDLNAGIQASMVDAESSFNQSVFDLQNNLYEQRSTRKSQIEDRDYEAEIRKAELAEKSQSAIDLAKEKFNQAQTTRISDLADFKERELFKQELKTAAEGVFGEIEALEFIKDLNSVTDPNLRREMILSAESQLRNSGLNVDMDSLLQSVLSAQQIFDLNAQYKSAQTNKANRVGTDNENGSGKIGDLFNKNGGIGDISDDEFDSFIGGDVDFNN